jgi:hypothetical protein
LSLVGRDFVNAGLRPPPPAAAALTKPRPTSPFLPPFLRRTTAAEPASLNPARRGCPVRKQATMQGPQRWLESNAALTPTVSLGAPARRNEPGAGRYADPILARPIPGS